MKIGVVLLAVLLVACAPGSPATTQSTPQAASKAGESAVPSPGSTAAATVPAAATQAAVYPAKCSAPATPTTASTEGPYFKAGSPEKTSLVTAGMSGTKIQLVGFVLTRSCAPVAGAKVDVWQADASGNYDNSGYTLRGYVLTDAQGKYSIGTIVPGRYPGRTPHIHVKVIAPGAPELTTQLYMPNESSNSSDGIFRPELVLTIIPTPYTGGFTFIVDRT